MPFSLARVANSPRMAQSFTITRSSGSYAAGGWKNTTTEIASYGVIAVADDRALEQVPEGDRVKGSLQLVTSSPIYTTSEERSAVSDQITWRGHQYRVQAVGPWIDFGFYSAILMRMAGA